MDLSFLGTPDDQHLFFVLISVYIALAVAVILVGTGLSWIVELFRVAIRQIRSWTLLTALKSSSLYLRIVRQ